MIKIAQWKSISTNPEKPKGRVRTLVKVNKQTINYNNELNQLQEKLLDGATVQTHIRE